MELLLANKSIQSMVQNTLQASARRLGFAGTSCLAQLEVLESSLSKYGKLLVMSLS